MLKMDIAVPSRFACLKIEDEDARPSTAKLKDVGKKIEKKLPVRKVEKEIKSSDKTKKPTSSSKQNANSGNKKEKKKASVQQWEEWKKRDDDIVNGTYEDDLQSAILLSKLDYEHNKELSKKIQDADEKEKNHKKKKSKAMSLEQFLNSDGHKVNGGPIQKPQENVKNEDFFKEAQIEAKIEAKNTVNKEQAKEKRKKREVNIDQVITIAVCQQELQQEKVKIVSLQQELVKLRSENQAIKERNKTLCHVLGQGEMKDKADVLLELERLYCEKTELTEEVSRMHALLEQERSKVAALSSDSIKHKEKFQKRKLKG